MKCPYPSVQFIFKVLNPHTHTHTYNEKHILNNKKLQLKQKIFCWILIKGLKYTIINKIVDKLNKHIYPNNNLTYVIKNNSNSSFENKMLL